MTLSRQGFGALLAAACLASFEAEVHGTRDGFQEQLAATPNRVQWDPERDLRLDELPQVRSLQLGIGAACVPDFVDAYCLRLRDITGLVHRLRERVDAGRLLEMERLLPVTRVYPMDPAVASRLGATAA